MMKILYLTFDTCGGLNHYLSQLASAVSSSEEVLVVGPRGLDTSRYGERVRHVEAHLGQTVQAFITDTLVPTRATDLLTVIRRERPDIIHVNGVNLWSTFVLGLVRNVPIVVTVHDVRPHTGERALDRAIALKLNLRLADKVIVHGSDAQRALGIGARCESFPHGDYSFFLGLGAQADEEDAVLFFGRIEDYKGLRHLLEAMPAVIERRPEARLLIVGGGDLQKYAGLMERVKNLEVHNRYVDDEEVPLFFQRAKVIVLPYTEGTQTGVVPIAYSFRKPVVVTDVGSIPEVVEDGVTGLVVPPGDRGRLAAAILDLLGDDDRRRMMGESAYEKMRSELAWEAISRRTIDLYRRLLS